MAGGQTLVVGIGNPLQGLDGFGPAVVARLRDRHDLATGVTLIDAGTDLFACLDRFVTADFVALVDAYLGSGSEIVSVLEESAFGAWPVDSPSAHNVSAALAVRLFRKLYPQARTVFVLVGLDAPSIDASTPLCAAAIDAGVGLVLALLDGAARKHRDVAHS